MIDRDAPRVTVHVAQTLDGQIATRTGHSQWISCEETRRFAHRLRSEHDAVLIGVGTVIADNPRLTVRLVDGRSPVRIVVDSTLRIPPGSQVLRDGAAPTILATTRRGAGRAIQYQSPDVAVLVCEEDQRGRVSLPALLGRLASSGIESILIEGGPAVITAALAAGIVDRYSVCIAPKLIGAGIGSVADLGITTMDDAYQLGDVRITTMGSDVIVDGRIARAVGVR